MPLYNFKCLDEECGHVTEELCDWGEDGIKCEKCGKVTRRLMGVPSLDFKGDGWADKDRKAGK